MAGCAWTDVVINLFPTMGTHQDTFLTASVNALTASLLSIVAVFWLVFSGEDPNTTPWNEVLSRDDVEQYFISGAMAFFVGWAWVLVLRDVYVGLSDLFGAASLHWRRIDSLVTDKNDDELLTYHTVEEATITIFVALLTLAFFALKHRIRLAHRAASHAIKQAKPAKRKGKKSWKLGERKASIHAGGRAEQAAPKVQTNLRAGEEGSPSGRAAHRRLRDPTGAPAGASKEQRMERLALLAEHSTLSA